MNTYTTSSLPSGHPDIRYDKARHPFVQDISGQWVPYFGVLPVPPMTQIHAHNNMEDGPNEPVTQAISHIGAAAPVEPAIDPALIPLPSDNDDDLVNGPTIARARGYAPASKVGSSRQQEKGKQHAGPTQSSHKSKEKAAPRKRKHESDHEDHEDSAKRGRPKGAGNYIPEEVSALLDLIEEELPMGQRGWQSIHCSFTRWACCNERPERAMKSLETKYKQLVKTTKPTGDGYCPPDVKHAHHIDALINERACTRDLNDSDFDDKAADDDSGSSEDGIEVTEHPKKTTRAADIKKEVRNAVVRRPDPLTQCRVARSNPADVIGRLADAFDPAPLQTRDDERAQCSFQASQMFALSQQLRDANTTIESLRSQVTSLQSQIHGADRLQDRLEIERRFENLDHQSKGHGCRSRKLSLPHVRGKYRCEEKYPEGGSHTYWVTDGSASSGSDFDNNKENMWPFKQWPSHRRNSLVASAPVPSTSGITQSSARADANIDDIYVPEDETFK